MNDIFACSMSKKSGSVLRAQGDENIFACSMAKKSSGTVLHNDNDAISEAIEIMDSGETMHSGNETRIA